MPLAAHAVRVQLDLLALHKIEVGGRKAGGVVLILLARKGTRRIDERAARGEHARRALQNFRLAVGAHQHVLLAPLGGGGSLFAQHPLPRAGRVDEDLVEIPIEAVGEGGGVGAGDDGVRDAHPLDVLQQDAGAVGHLFVEHEQALPLHRLRDLRRRDRDAGRPRGKYRRAFT